MNDTAKRVLIVGGSSGIGLACALKLYANGTEVVLVGRDADRLTAAGSQMPDAIAVNADVACEEGRNRILEAAGPVDGVVYSAGGNTLKPARFLKENFLQSMTDVHLHAPLLLLAGLLRKGQLHRGGSVVWIGSIAAFAGSPGNVAYTASKAGLMASVRPLARELAPMQVRVNAVAPGLVDTPMTQRIFDGLAEDARRAELAKYPLGLPSAAEVADAVEFLLSDASRKISGTVLTLDGAASA